MLPAHPYIHTPPLIPRAYRCVTADLEFRCNKQRHSPNYDSVSPNSAQRTENSIQKYKELHMSILLQEEGQAVVIVTDHKRKLYA